MRSQYLQLQSRLSSAAAQIWRYCSPAFALLQMSSLHTYPSASEQPGTGRWNNWTPGPLWQSPSGLEHCPHKHPASPGTATLTPCTTSSTSLLLSLESLQVGLPPVCSWRPWLPKISLHKESNTSSTLPPASRYPCFPALHPTQQET